MEAAAKVVLYVVFGLPAAAMIAVPAVIWRGYVLSVLWGWFAVPRFDVAPLSIPYAIGLAMIACMATSQRTWREATDKDVKWAPFVMLFAGPALTLCTGWIVKQYI